MTTEAAPSPDDTALFREWLRDYEDGLTEDESVTLRRRTEARVAAAPALLQERDRLDVDGGLLEQAIRNLKREQLAKGWTGNLTDGWTIADEYNRLAALAATPTAEEPTNG